ncbi:hypothetical protein SteCoe_2555 [Stentor coeruleus]|uniref:LITAF domain-containing protein n=1 Tax=Stentor coeruleus TaxID=5963 RepID=A0A1R2CIV9_9CILI|nr:hypothetical protein SteCoe_9096 [Stentor coeruleus]OMJ94351.1 hypothetical protein SteCoe_2555 [Stentor coeruleus]
MDSGDRRPLVENNQGGPQGFGQPAPQAYPPSNYAPQNYPPQNYPPANYMPSGPQPGYPGAYVPPPNSGQYAQPLNSGPYPPAYPPQNQPRYIVQPLQPGFGGQIVGANFLILGDMATEVVCPHCRQTVLTNVQKRAGNTAWIICLILCCFCFPFCIYPLICDPCLDTYHICPACQQVISIKTP